MLWNSLCRSLAVKHYVKVQFKQGCFQISNQKKTWPLGGQVDSHHSQETGSRIMVLTASAYILLAMYSINLPMLTLDILLPGALRALGPTMILEFLLDLAAVAQIADFIARFSIGFGVRV